VTEKESSMEDNQLDPVIYSYLLTELLAATLFRIADRHYRRFKLSYVSYLVLIYLEMCGGSSTQAAISKFIHGGLPSTHDLIRRMANKGLIKRAKNLDHKYHVGISITEAGLMLIREVPGVTAFKRVYSSLDSRTIQNIIVLYEDILIKASSKLKKNGKQIAFLYREIASKLSQKAIMADKELDHFIIEMIIHSYMLIIASYEFLKRIRQKYMGSRYRNTAASGAILTILDSFGGEATQAQIHKSLLTSLPAICTLVQRMEEKELIIRSKDLEKKNQVRIKITSDGQKLLGGWHDISSVVAVLLSSKSNDWNQTSIILEKMLAAGLKINKKPSRLVINQTRLRCLKYTAWMKERQSERE
jgi:DNA-binding MarR family transcriptional regulator